MAPKRKEQQKMSLGDFLTDEKLGSWADEMEDMPVSDSRTGYGGEKRTYGSTNAGYGSGNLAGYSVREELPLPDKPPYTVHLGNLSFDATVGDVTDFFDGCDCVNVRIIEDKMEMKPKGFGYAEFGTREGLIKALALSGSQFQGRNIRVSVADPPKDRDPVREISDWSRKGPLPDLPGRGANDRRGAGGYGAARTFGDAGSDAGGERRERREFNQDDGKVRDFGNWERRGPLAPIPGQDRPTRDGGRTSTVDGPRADGFRDRKASPAAWGEGRGQDSQDGSRPPRREFQERPVVDRTPTAAEQDSQWRTKMRPDAPVASSTPSHDGSETPGSPAAAPAPAGRPKLNLTKRTVSEATDASPAATPAAAGDAKASPFGAARPIDTAAKEREIEEKRVAALKEKKEADDKAREEKRLAKELAAREEVEAAAKEAANPDLAKKTENLTLEEGSENKEAANEKPVEAAKPKPAETGAWRRPAGGPKPPQADARGPRRDGPPRAPRTDSQRGPRTNGAAPAAAAAPAADSEAAAPAPAAAQEDDGWSTVQKPKKNLRGGRA